jgi:hypothetical protein
MVTSNRPRIKFAHTLQGQRRIQQGCVQNFARHGLFADRSWGRACCDCTQRTYPVITLLSDILLLVCNNVELRSVTWHRFEGSPGAKPAMTLGTSICMLVGGYTADLPRRDHSMSTNGSMSWGLDAA